MQAPPTRRRRPAARPGPWGTRGRLGPALQRTPARQGENAGSVSGVQKDAVFAPFPFSASLCQRVFLVRRGKPAYSQERALHWTDDDRPPPHAQLTLAYGPSGVPALRRGPRARHRDMTVHGSARLPGGGRRGARPRPRPARRRPPPLHQKQRAARAGETRQRDSASCAEYKGAVPAAIRHGAADCRSTPRAGPG